MKGRATISDEFHHAKSTRRLLILIAGPCRSGTDDDPQCMAANLRRLARYALAIYRAGHVPMVGEGLRFIDS